MKENFERKAVYFTSRRMSAAINLFYSCAQRNFWTVQNNQRISESNFSQFHSNRIVEKKVRGFWNSISLIRLTIRNFNKIYN